MFTAVLFKTATMEATPVPITRLVDKKTVVHVHNAAERKMEILPFETASMDLDLMNMVLREKASQRKIKTT